MGFIYNDVIFFMLIFLRISGLFFFSPFFSSEAMNRRIKLGFALFIAIIVFPVIPKDASLLQNLAFSGLVGMVAKELLIGTIIGFFMLMMFSIVQTAAQIYSMDMGYSMVNVFDPMSQLQIPVLGQFKYLFFMEIFFLTGMHRQIIMAITESFYRIRIGAVNYHYNNLAEEMVKNFSYYFMISIKIALPVIAVLFISDVALGIMARIAPQMNVFVVGMPLKILVGLLFLMAFVPYTVNYFEFLMGDGLTRVLQLLKKVVY